MESHLNPRVGSMPRPVQGEVKAVHHAPIIGETVIPFTLYDVEIWPQTAGFSGAVGLTSLAYSGQQSGGSIEQNVPLVVGQKVEVDFWEGDYNRPYIRGKWIDEGSAFAATPPDADEHPRARWLCNGIRIEVSKDGNLEIFEHENDLELIRLVKVTGSWQLHLGGKVGVQRLVTEQFITSLKAAITLAPVATGDGGSAFKSALAAALDTAFIDANTTAVAMAK